MTTAPLFRRGLCSLAERSDVRRALARVMTAL